MKSMVSASYENPSVGPAQSFQIYKFGFSKSRSVKKQLGEPGRAFWEVWVSATGFILGHNENQMLHRITPLLPLF